FPAGVTVQLTFSVAFTDGNTYSTDDDTTDSSFMTWAISPAGTGATISTEGSLNTAAVMPGTTLKITATGKNPYDSVTDSIDVVFTTSLAGESIDIFDTGSGKLFTSSPSVAYLESIGGSNTNGTYSETGHLGPSGLFYRFYWDNANALCDTYNERSVGGRTDWRLATIDELKDELYGTFDSMFTARFWPTQNAYWSANPAGPGKYIRMSLHSGDPMDMTEYNGAYASCVSDPSR
ncbi:DUF1566 domain-containing protein, partial [Vibrio chagasii]|uniref:Lcl domain-containing protein n=1 Tax=Vibrio chagasii TaxID=170679 RepID=UPI002284333B